MTLFNGCMECGCPSGWQARSEGGCSCPCHRIEDDDLITMSDIERAIPGVNRAWVNRIARQLPGAVPPIEPAEDGTRLRVWRFAREAIEIVRERHGRPVGRPRKAVDGPADAG